MGAMPTESWRVRDPPAARPEASGKGMACLRPFVAARRSCRDGPTGHGNEMQSHSYELSPHDHADAGPEAVWQRIAWPQGGYPAEDLLRAEELAGEIAPFILSTLDAVLADPESYIADEKFFGVHFGLLLLARLRDARGFLPAMRILQLPHDVADGLLGDMITETIPAILASTCQGDVDALKGLYENEDLDEFVRIAGLTAMGVLVQNDLLPRSQLSAYIGEVLGRLRREASYVWDQLVCVASDLVFVEHRDAILSLYDEGLADSMVDTREDVAARFAGHDRSPSPRRYRLIDDVVDETRGWACFRQERSAGVFGAPSGAPDPRQPFVRATRKVGRNDPCLCGSGKKFKKCCGP